MTKKPLVRNIADEVNQNGSAFYKDHKYKDAIAAYERATKLDAKEPKYPSNLSAVLYEVGNYTGAIQSIASAWSRLKLSQDEDDADADAGPVSLDNPLAVKLVTRFAKARININAACEARTGAQELRHESKETKQSKLEAQVEQEMDEFVARATTTKVDDLKLIEMRKTWASWMSIRAEMKWKDLYDCRVSEGQKRFRALPILKAAPDPTIQSFAFSTDECRSLLNPLGETTFDRKLTLKNPKQSKSVSWSFLFGGSGDARHAFTTLSHVAAEMKRGTKVDSLHLTMVDIHPATQARFLILMALLQQILDNVNDNPDQKLEREIDLYAAVFFAFSSVAMPDTCCDLVIEAADSLVKKLPDKTHPLSKYIYFDDASLASVVDALAYWAKPLPKSTKKLLSLLNQLPPRMADQAESQASSSRLKALKDAGRRVPTAFDSNDAEQLIFRRTKILLPPRSHIERYPALKELASTYDTAPPSLYVKVREELERTWKPNPTLFDTTFTEWEVPFLGPNNFKGYPQFASYFYHENFHNSLKTTASNIAGQPSRYCGYTNGFDTTTQFFTMVTQSLAMLKGVLQIEVVVGDVLTGIPRMVVGDVGPWPDKGFPQKFTRMWLSNVPDYTHGLLSTAIYLVPYLEDRQIAVANNLGFFGWRSMDEYCYNYTLLLVADLPRFLGCQMVNPHKNVMYEDIALEKLPQPRTIDTLASKKQLHDWLSRLLLCILCTGTCEAPPSRIDMPSNLGLFFHLLAHLTSRVGFPAHWIGDFVQSMLTDTLMTDAVPYQGSLPIPSSFARKKAPASRKVNLHAWQAEMEVIIASTRRGLPFFVSPPGGYASSLDEIHTYKTYFLPVNLLRHPRYLAFGSSLPYLLTPFSGKIVGLIFYKPQRGIDGDIIAASIADILEGSGTMKDLQVQILLSQERVDVYQDMCVSWKMSKRRFEKMKAEKWEMVVYRTDVHCAITYPAKAGKWEREDEYKLPDKLVSSLLQSLGLDNLD